MKKFLFLFVFVVVIGCNNQKKDNNISYDSSGFVEVSSVIHDVIYDIRYYSPYNFTGKRVNGYNSNRAFLTKEAAHALKNAADKLREKGYRIVIYDAYRPQKAVDCFVKWMADVDDEGIKSFYPNIKDKNDLIKGSFVATKSGHTRGSVVDMTIVKMDGTSVDMGGTFDLFDRLSNRNYDGITKEQLDNRKLLENIMIEAGFEPLPSEWWHFVLKNEPYPNTYFDFDIQ